MGIDNPHLWGVEDPYLYQVRTEVFRNGKLADTYMTVIGIRDVKFDADRGFFLNGKPLKLKGVNMHQDHAGVGSSIPDALHIA